MWALVNSYRGLGDADLSPFVVRASRIARTTATLESLGAHDERRLLEILTALEQVTGIRTLNRTGALERRGYANAAIRDLDKGYLVQRVNGLHVSDGDREGALVRLHGEMQGDGDLVRLLLIRANEQKAGMQLDRPRRFSALPIMPLDIERSKSFADWPQDQHDFWMYRLGNMALVQGPEDQLDRLSEYPARRDRMLLRADSRRFPLTNQLKDFADCTPALLEARQEEAVRLIVEYWGIRYDKDARDLTKQNVDELSKTSPRPSHSSRRVTIRQVIDAGLLVPGERLVWERPRKGERWFATVTENGRLRLDDGSEYPTPTAAARAAAGGHGEVFFAVLHRPFFIGAGNQVLEAGGVGRVARDGHLNALLLHNGNALEHVVGAVALHRGAFAVGKSLLAHDLQLAGLEVVIRLHIGEAVDAADDILSLIHISEPTRP